MKWLKYISVFFAVLLSAQVFAAEDEPVAGEASGEPQLDIQGIIFGHIGDAYQWHITRIGDKELTIPLPVIVRSKDSGWPCFLSSKLEDGPYQGFTSLKAGNMTGR